MPDRDIETRVDCEQLVRRFYSRALTDSLIGWIFTDVAKLDMEEHIPKVASFWETILLGAATYGGGAFAPHVPIHQRSGGFKEGHFMRWLKLWHEAVDELFAGPRADLAKAHADRVARAFHARLEGRPEPEGEILPLTLTLAVTQHGPR